MKTALLIMLLSFRLVAEDTTYEEHHKGASMINAPLQSELTEVYRSSEKAGKKAGKNTKNFFCSELHWTFFCTGED